MSSPHMVPSEKNKKILSDHLCRFNADKAQVTQALTSVPEKLDELVFLLEETKKDVIKRKCEPPPGRMAYLELQSTEVQTQMDTVLDIFSKDNKHKWKKIWEHELGTIVQEQNTLKAQEQQATQIDEKLDSFLNEFDDVARVLELIKKTGGNAATFVPPPPLPDFVDDSNQGIKDILMTQIKSQSVSPALSQFSSRVIMIIFFLAFLFFLSLISLCTDEF